MLESRIIRRDPERVKVACLLRGVDLGAEVDELAALDARRGELLSAARELREQQNLLRLRFPELERAGKSSVPLQIELRLLARKTAVLEAELEEREERRRALLLLFPNLPRGRAAEPVRRWGVPAVFPYPLKSARVLGEGLGIFVPPPGLFPGNETKARTKGPGIPVFPDGPSPRTGAGACREDRSVPAPSDGLPPLLGMGARLARALESYWLDALAAGGLTEYRLPDGPADEMQGVTPAVGALMRPHRGRVYPAGCALPGGCAVFSGREGGDISAMLLLAAPGQDGMAMERLLSLTGKALRGLGLPFELSPLEPAQLPFEAAAGWSAGVWMPSSGRYETAAVISACGDFLSRRIACRCRQEGERRLRPAETACGTADLSVLLRALLENGQDGGGSAAVPEALRPLTGAKRLARQRQIDKAR